MSSSSSSEEGQGGRMSEFFEQSRMTGGEKSGMEEGEEGGFVPEEEEQHSSGAIISASSEGEGMLRIVSKERLMSLSSTSVLDATGAEISELKDEEVEGRDSGSFTGSRDADASSFQSAYDDVQGESFASSQNANDDSVLVPETPEGSAVESPVGRKSQIRDKSASMQMVGATPSPSPPNKQQHSLPALPSNFQTDIKVKKEDKTVKREFNFKRKEAVPVVQVKTETPVVSKFLNPAKEALPKEEDNRHTPDNMLHPVSTLPTSTPLMSSLQNRKKFNMGYTTFTNLDITEIPKEEDIAESSLRPSPKKEDAHAHGMNDTAETEVLGDRSISPPVRNKNNEVTINSDIDTLSDGDNDEEEESDSLSLLGAVGGVKKAQRIVYSDDEEEEDVVGDISRRLANQSISKPKNKKLEDFDEIAERMKKQQISRKKPLIQYLENVPEVNPFQKPLQERRPGRDFDNVRDFTSDAMKCVRTLSEMLETMPMDDKEENVEFTPPKGLRINLYPHQVYGVRWMSWRERYYPGGGILADEMGLGKTIMTIALVLDGKQKEKENRGMDQFDWLVPDNRKLVPSNSTLVVCPLGCIGQWESEVKGKAKGLNVEVHQGAHRSKSASYLAGKDVVVTTYNVLSSEIPKPDDDPRDRCCSPLFRVHWERIILDEGHIIRNHKTHGALSACRLSANHRWVVTGTPVHNHASDFYSIVKFLRLEPFSDAEVWKSWVAPFGAKKINDKKGSELLFNLGRALLLRRTKEEVAASGKGSGIPEIPLKTVEDIQIVLNEQENNVYGYVFAHAKEVMKKFLEDRNLDRLQNAADRYVHQARTQKEAGGKNQFANVLALITRLRQLAVLPFLIKAMLEDDDEGEDEDEDETVELISAKNPIFAPGYRSSKIRAMLEELEAIKEEASIKEEPMDKVVVVSQWSSFLDIFGQHLRKKGFTYVQLDGRTPIDERKRIMEIFNSNKKKPQILLLSITAGGVGLNLTGANRMFVVEPQWNPQVERQAYDRIHRFGQTKPVFIKRFVVDESIEPRLLAVQAQKLQMSDDLLSAANKGKGKKGMGLNLNDMKKIFGITD